MKEMTDFSAMKSFFQKEELLFFIFQLISQKPIKAVMRQCPSITPAG
jgi:hypothetical protein